MSMMLIVSQLPLPNVDTHPHLSTVYEVWDINGEYVVILAQTGKYNHVRIRRTDNKPITEYSIFQEIKNKFIGEEKEAVQVFPKKMNYVDNSNTYHLFAWDGMDLPNLKEMYRYMQKPFFCSNEQYLGSTGRCKDACGKDGQCEVTE